MMPVCLALKHYHVLLAVLGGAAHLRHGLAGPGGLASYAIVGPRAEAAGTLQHDALIETEHRSVGVPTFHHKTIQRHPRRNAAWRSPMKFRMITTFFGRTASAVTPRTSIGSARRFAAAGMRSTSTTAWMPLTPSAATTRFGPIRRRRAFTFTP